MANDAFRRIRQVFSVEGAEAVVAANQRVAQSQQGIAGSSSTTEKATLSLERQFASLERRYNTAVRAQQDYERVQRQVNAAIAQNSSLMERGAVIIDLAAKKYEALGASATRAASAMRSVPTNLSSSINQSIGVRDDFNTAGRAQDIAAYGAALDNLRAKYNPLFAAGQEYRKTLQDINQAARVGAISEKERGEAVSRTKDAFAQHVTALNATTVSSNKLTSSTGLARHEMVNLSRQMQDVFVTMQAGQPITTILVQQGTQIADIFATSRITFRGFATQLAAMVPLSVGLGVSLAAIAAAGVAAAISWGNAQRAIQLALTGAGRASGATPGSINAAAAAGSSTFGLSVSEARDLATQLAATGKIGVDAIGGIVKIGHDVATVYGIDATDAAKMLAKAFSDPVNGANELNDRLGLLDASTLRQLKNLKEQNDLFGAQNLLLEKVKESLNGVSESVSGSTKIWTALGNAISNAWNAFGAWASRATGIGFTQGLDERLEEARKKVADLRASLANGGGDFGLGLPGVQEDSSASIVAQLKKEEESLRSLEDAWDKYQQSVTEAQQRRDSFAAAEAVNKISPEINSLQELTNQYLLLQNKLNEVVDTGGKASPVLQALGVTFEQLQQAVQRAGNAVINFKTSSQEAMQSLESQINSIGKRSPADLGQQAYEEAIRRLGNTEEGIAEAKLRRTLAQRQAEQQLTDAVNERILSAKQSTESARLELSLVGQTAAAQEAAKAKLQAKHQLEQEALRVYGDRNAYDKDHLNALEKEYDQQEKIKKFVASTQLQRDIDFEKKLVFLSDIDKEIAQRLRPTMGDNVTANLKTTEAAELRQIDIMKQLKSASDSFINNFVTGLAQGKDLMESLRSAAQGLGSTLIQIGSQNITSSLFGSATQAGGGALGGGLASLLGLGSAAGGPIGAGLALAAGAAISFLSKSKEGADQAAKAAQELADAQQKWRDMASDFSAWIHDWTTGVSGELHSAISSARSQMQQFANAAAAAHDPGGVASAQAAFNTGVTRSINESLDALLNLGVETSSYSQKLKEAKDKAEDIRLTLIEFGTSAEDAALAVETRLNVAVSRLRDQFLDDLVRKVNELAGGAWINQLTDLVDEVAQLRTDAAALGIQTGLIDEYFVRAAQKIIDENQLVGSAFDAVAATLGPLGAGLHEFSAAAEEAAQALKRSAQEIANTIQSYQDQLFIAQQDTQTLAGQLAVFDLQAQRAREQEIAAGGEALAALEALQAQQRLNIINDYNRRIAEEQQRALEQQLEAQRRAAEEAQRVWDEAAKFLQNATQNIQNWISSFLGGSQSPLSPLARLSSAQSTFSTQYSAALGGNRDALQGITGNAQTLGDAIKSVYGSTTAGQTLINQMLSELQSLPAQLSPEQFIVDNLTPAINDVTAGVDAQTSAMQTLFADLQSAVNSGNASAIAAALLPVFNSIDTNTDNALTFAEMQSALGATYSTGTLRSIFTELDGNGNGILEKSELIKTATQNTGTNTGSTSTNTANMPQMANNISSINGNTLTTGQNTANTVTALGGYSGSNYLTAAVNNLNSILSALGSSGVIAQKFGDAGISNSLIGEAERIRSNLYEQNLNWGDGWSPSGATYISAGAQIQPYATGGYVYGPSHANGGRIIEVEGGEYIVNKRDTARFRAQLDDMNFGYRASSDNDNGDTRELIARIVSLERRLTSAVVSSGSEVAGRIDKLNSIQEDLSKRIRVRSA